MVVMSTWAGGLRYSDGQTCSRLNAIKRPLDKGYNTTGVMTLAYHLEPPGCVVN